jgi:hypothetical protein
MHRWECAGITKIYIASYKREIKSQKNLLWSHFANCWKIILKKIQGEVN